MSQTNAAATRRVGAAALILGVAALLTLRVWASPIARTVTGREGVTVLSFLGIPVFLVLFGVGIALLVWGPEIRASLE